LEAFLVKSRGKKHPECEEFDGVDRKTNVDIIEGRKKEFLRGRHV